MILRLDVVVSPAAFSRLTVTRVEILRFSLKIRRFALESLIVSVTFPPGPTVNDLRASATRFLPLLLRLTRTFPTLSKLALPVSPSVALKVKAKRPPRLTLIEDFEPAKLAGDGAAAGVVAAPALSSAAAVTAWGALVSRVSPTVPEAVTWQL